ncbi:hypothetical protein ACEPAG_3266 [Sanghuangporus baumii]
MPSKMRLERRTQIWKRTVVPEKEIVETRLSAFEIDFSSPSGGSYITLAPMLRSGFNTIIPHKLRSAGLLHHTEVLPSFTIQFLNMRILSILAILSIAFAAAAAPIPGAEPDAAGLSGLSITLPLGTREAEADPEAGCGLMCRRDAEPEPAAMPEPPRIVA